MTLVGGGRTGGVGGTETASSPDTGGGSGTIEEITSSDGSINVTNPTGPIVDLTAQATDTNLFDVTLSYGHGQDIDAGLPPGTSFWLTATTIADLARADEVRQWPTDKDLTVLGLDVVASMSSALGEGGLPLIVTIDGVDSALSVTISDGIVDDTLFTTGDVAISVPAGSFVGVRVDGSLIGEGASVRLQARLRGGNSGPSGGLTLVTHDSTLEGDGTPSVPLSTRIKTISGTNGVDVTSSSGNYTLRGSFIGQPGGATLGSAAAGGGMISLDVTGSGRQIESARQLVGCHLNARVLNDSAALDWSAFSDFYKTQGSVGLITDAWIVVRQFSGGVVTVAPQITLYIDTSTSPIQISTPFGPSASDVNNAGLAVPFTIPIRTSFDCSRPINYLVSGTPGNGPGLTAKVTAAATGPASLLIVLMLAIELDINGAANP